MWAGPASTKVIVTTTVEWTGRSFLKSIIERSAIDGQRTYHADLERAMRQYILSHPTEFIPAGSDAVQTADALESASDAQLTSALSPTGDKPIEFTPTDRRKVAEQRSLQWALDTFTSAISLTSQSFWGLIDILGDLWEGAPDMPDMPDSSTFSNGRIWWVVVVFLLGLNIWTWSSLHQSRTREELTRRRMSGTIAATVAAADGADKDKLANVATEAVRLFWEGVVERQNDGWKKELETELARLRGVVETLEMKMAKLEETKHLNDLD